MAFCENCGRQIPDRARFCPACGTEREPTVPQQTYTPPVVTTQQTNTQTVTRKERQTRSSGSGKKIGKILLFVLVIAAVLAGGIFIGTQLGGDREQTVSERPKFTLFGMDNRKDAVSVNTEEWVYFPLSGGYSVMAPKNATLIGSGHFTIDWEGTHIFFFPDQDCDLLTYAETHWGSPIGDVVTVPGKYQYVPCQSPVDGNALYTIKIEAENGCWLGYYEFYDVEENQEQFLRFLDNARLHTPDTANVPVDPKAALAGQWVDAKYMEFHFSAPADAEIYSNFGSDYLNLSWDGVNINNTYTTSAHMSVEEYLLFIAEQLTNGILGEIVTEPGRYSYAKVSYEDDCPYIVIFQNGDTLWLSYCEVEESKQSDFETFINSVRLEGMYAHSENIYPEGYEVFVFENNEAGVSLALYARADMDQLYNSKDGITPPIGNGEMEVEAVWLTFEQLTGGVPMTPEECAKWISREYDDMSRVKAGNGYSYIVNQDNTSLIAIYGDEGGLWVVEFRGENLNLEEVQMMAESVWLRNYNRVYEEPAAEIPAAEEPAYAAPAPAIAQPEGFETYVSGDATLFVPENMQNLSDNAAELNMDFLLSGNDLVIAGGLRPFDELTGSYITAEECAKLYCENNSLDSESVEIWDGGNYHYLYYTTGGYTYFCAFYQSYDGIWFLQIMAPMLNLDLAYTIADSVTILY